MWRKPLKQVGKISPKTLFKSCRKQSKGTPIYRHPKSSRWGPKQQLTLLTVDRSVDRQRSDFRPLSHRRPASRPGPGYREQKLSVGRPPGRPGPDLESRTLWRSTGSIDRPSSQTRPCMFVHVGRPPDQPTSVLVDHAVDQPKARIQV